MAFCEFSHTVKYGGAFHAPFKPFEVAENDVEELVALGAKVLPQSREVAQTQSKPKEQKVVKKAPYKIPHAKKG